MGAKRGELIETNVERVAVATFAAAVGYAVFALSGLPQPEGGIAVAVAMAISFYFCRGALAAFAEREVFTVPSFEIREIEFDDELILTDADRLDIPDAELLLTEQVVPNELLLTDADRIGTEVEPLELDDILAELGPDSRVVRLFDRKAMPTPGELKSSIDSHLGRRAPEPVQSDAAQALSEALAELRRSLR